jgi:hypothetical protein
MDTIDYEIIFIYCLLLLLFIILLLCLLELSTVRYNYNCSYRNIIREGSLFARLIRHIRMRTNIVNIEIINNPQLDNIQHISQQNLDV